jgi:hypothetical protein
VLPLRTARTTLLTLFVSSAFAAQACGDERVGAAADSDAGARADSDAGSGDGTCDRFCVWDRLMETGRRGAYARCICQQTSQPNEPIQAGLQDACENGVEQTELLEYEPDCVAAMTDDQIAEIEAGGHCFEEQIAPLLPCLDNLGAGDKCGSCESIYTPEGMPARCPTSYETTMMVRRCTDGRPGF